MIWERLVGAGIATVPAASLTMIVRWRRWAARDRVGAATSGDPAWGLFALSFRALAPWLTADALGRVRA